MIKNFLAKLNFSKILSFLIFVLSFLLIIYIYYRQYYFYSGSKISYAGFYYSIGFSGIISSIIIFFLTSSLSKKLLILFLSTIMSIYVVEYSINYINLKDSLRISLAKKDNIKYDNRTILEVVSDLKKKNKKIGIGFPTVGYVQPNGFNIKNKQIYPLGGISNVKTVVCNTFFVPTNLKRRVFTRLFFAHLKNL